MIYGVIIFLLAIGDLTVKQLIERQEAETFPRPLEGTKGKILLYQNHNAGFPFGVFKKHEDLVRMLPLAVTSALAGALAALAAGTADLALLPQPFVTVAQGKLGDGLRVALDLTAEWDALGNGSAMITGVAVARRDFVEQSPEAVRRFLGYYAESVDWVNANPGDAAALIAEYGIVESAAVAEKALPHCNIVCLTGEEMKEKLSGYLAVLAEAAPECVGGQLPGDGFYYLG